MNDFRFFIFQLKHLKGIGNIGLLKIIRETMEKDWMSYTNTELAQIGNVQRRYFSSFEASRQNVLNNLQQLYQLYQPGGFLTILDKEYPECLREIYNPPAALFYQGKLSLLNKKSVAVIGSRNNTNYGEQMTSLIVPDLVQANIVIVSGLASGIDTLAHQYTIRNDGATIGIIGSGLDIVYPKSNKRIQDFIGKRHLLLSEYPYGTAPLRHHFPMRNRLIAGISKGTCVIEAKQKSGTFITAQLALEEGREVFAVPGSVVTKQSDGCHLLIQQGAKCVWNGQQIAEDIHQF